MTGAAGLLYPLLLRLLANEATCRQGAPLGNEDVACGSDSQSTSSAFLTRGRKVGCQGIEEEPAEPGPPVTAVAVGGKPETSNPEGAVMAEAVGASPESWQLSAVMSKKTRLAAPRVQRFNLSGFGAYVNGESLQRI